MRACFYAGFLRRYDAKSGWYHVTYEDGDQEELSSEELSEIVINAQLDDDSDDVPLSVMQNAVLTSRQACTQKVVTKAVVKAKRRRPRKIVWEAAIDDGVSRSDSDAEGSGDERDEKPSKAAPKRGAKKARKKGVQKSVCRAGRGEDGQDARSTADPSVPKPANRDTSASKRTVVNNQIRAAKQTALKRGIVQFAKHLDVLRPFITPQTAERVEREAKQSHYSGLLGLADFDGQPAYIAGGQMKPYQIEGVAFLISLHDSGMLGGILGDEMGLGKTMQVLPIVSAHRPLDVGVVGGVSMT